MLYFAPLCRYCFILVMAVLLLSVVKVADANDKPQTDIDNSSLPTLAVTIEGIKDKAYLDNINVHLDIEKLVGQPIANPSYIRFLADKGRAQIQSALQPFGYYQASVDRHLNKTTNAWTLTYRVNLGEPVKVVRMVVRLVGAGQHDKALQNLLASCPLKVGDVLVQSKYRDCKDDLRVLAAQRGYFDADFSRAQIIIDDDYRNADIILIYQTGRRYDFGAITIKQDFLNADVFRRYIDTFDLQGKPYLSSMIADLQRDLYNSRMVKVIDVSASPDKARKTVPVEFAITPAKNKRHTFAIGYGTDTGARGRYDFAWHWVNRRGHQFDSKVFVAQKKQTITESYRIPGKHPATDYYRLFVDANHHASGDDHYTTWGLGAAYHDKKGKLQRELGVSWKKETFTIGDDRGTVGLLAPYLSLTYRRVDDVLHVGDGLRVSATLTGANDSVASDLTFLQAVASAKYIKRLDKAHKLTLKAAVGKTAIDDFHRLPASYRFFSGGDKTLRGYGFESIGDRDSNGHVIGGDSMYSGSVEYEYFFTDKMAVAAFIDVGNAYSDSAATAKIGAGFGFHYYSPIGPIKVDIAHGFDDPGDAIRLHLSIGPEL